MKSFEMMDGKIGYFENGEFIEIKIEVEYWRHYCEYREKCKSLDDAISFAKWGEESDDMAFFGIWVDDVFYDTTSAFTHSHIYDTWSELKNKIIQETISKSSSGDVHL